MKKPRPGIKLCEEQYQQLVNVCAAAARDAMKDGLDRWLRREAPALVTRLVQEHMRDRLSWQSIGKVN